VEAERNYVILETEGPGCIDRIWCTRKTEEEPYELRVTLDGSSTPGIRIDLDRLFSGKRPPFVPPFAGSVDKARYSYVPVCYRVHLPAGVPFRTSLRLSWEHGSGNTDGGTYAGCVWYYLLPTRSR
jgi:hypothetical protein